MAVKVYTKVTPIEEMDAQKREQKNKQMFNNALEQFKRMTQHPNTLTPIAFDCDDKGRICMFTELCKLGGLDHQESLDIITSFSILLDVLLAAIAYKNN
jgi:hypothetical protein